MEKYDYNTDLEIDKFNLDTCIIKQPILYERYSTLYVEAVEIRDRLKLKLEETYAIIDKEIRQKYILSGMKITEKAIENEIIVDSDYKKAMDKYMSAKKDAETFGVLKESFGQRKDMLKLLVELHITNYYSSLEDQQQKSFTRDAIKKELRERKS